MNQNNAKSAPVFVLRQGQKQANLDILNYVAKHQPCGFLTLRDQFGQGSYKGQFGQDSYKGLKARLSHLVLTDQLQADKAGCSMDSWTFALGEMAGKRGRELSAQAKAKATKQDAETTQRDVETPEQGGQAKTQEPPAPPYVGVIVQARQIDVMSGPGYLPKPMQPARPGSDDFTRCPSLRQGQRLPFTAGHYVGVTGGKS